MSLHIIYKNLFEIKLFHHYFLDKGEEIWDAMEQEEKDKIEALYDIRDIFEIIPTPDCINVLESHYCIFKNTSSGILVGIKAKPDKIQPLHFNPFVPLSKDLTFRFLIRLKDTNFKNYTALPLQGNSGTMFIFKNYTLNSSQIFPSLSAIPPVYSAATDYMPGDMLSDHPVNQTKLFTALVKTSNNTSTASDWLTETGDTNTPLDYANVNDRYPVANGFFFYTMKLANVQPKATLKNFSGEIIKPAMENIPGDFYSLQVDMRNFPQGFYSIHVESDAPVYQDDITFYLLQQSEFPFGLIEITVKSDQADYDLTDPVHLSSPSFELRFRNRRTFWRYFGKIFNTPFEVEHPLPLTRYGSIEVVKPPEPEDTKTIILPNPSGSMIMAEALAKPDEKKYYSDIHIN
jgi:hypothetical protein